MTCLWCLVLLLWLSCLSEGSHPRGNLRDGLLLLSGLLLAKEARVDVSTSLRHGWHRRHSGEGERKRELELWVGDRLLGPSLLSVGSLRNRRNGWEAGELGHNLGDRSCLLVLCILVLLALLVLVLVVILLALVVVSWAGITLALVLIPSCARAAVAVVTMVTVMTLLTSTTSLVVLAIVEVSATSSVTTAASTAIVASVSTVVSTSTVIVVIIAVPSAVILVTASVATTTSTAVITTASTEVSSFSLSSTTTSTASHGTRRGWGRLIKHLVKVSRTLERNIWLVVAQGGRSSTRCRFGLCPGRSRFGVLLLRVLCCSCIFPCLLLALLVSCLGLVV